jgi:predicted Zn finger-like uncharacterized protein
MTGAVSTLGEALRLFTQCSKCETVFKLSAEVLRAAGGQVRCGNCGEVFNALARLAEDSSSFTVGESELDLEARAYSILETVPPPPHVAHDVTKHHHGADEDYDEFAPPGVEIARLEILDIDDGQDGDAMDAEHSMEFTLPPGELDRIFIESKRPKPPQSPSLPEPLLPESLAPESLAPDESLVPESLDSPVEPESEPALEPPPPHPESLAAQSPSIPHHISGFEVPEHVRRDILAEFEQHIGTTDLLRSSRQSNARRRSLILWLGAAIVLALLLAAQIVHQNREWFAAHAHGPVGAVVRALYGVLGAPLPAPANLAAYELRQWGVTGEPDANGALRVRASILNTAAQLQPYPLLRVTLADRFGKNIGTRDFEPAEYLGRPTAKLLAPGERVDATVAILDPGKNAEGFEIDVCLRGVDRRVACANDVAPQAGR